MDVEEVVSATRDLLFKVEKLVDEVKKVKKVYGIFSPNRVWAIYMLSEYPGDKIALDMGGTTMEFEKYDGDVRVVEDVFYDTKVLKVGDIAEVDYGWIEDIADVMRIMYGGNRRAIIKDMLSNIYVSGKDMPVGFVYEYYFGIIAPRVEVKESELRGWS